MGRNNRKRVIVYFKQPIMPTVKVSTTVHIGCVAITTGGIKIKKFLIAAIKSY